MRILFITNIFPSPCQPTKGVFNLTLARALAHDHELRVVAPIAWADEWRSSARSLLGSERRVVLDGIEVHHPVYYYTPGILRRLYGWFFWKSTRRTILRLVNSFRPDAVLGYWLHPDGETALRAGRLANAPVVLMTGGTDALILTRDPARKRCIERILRDADAVIAVSRDLATRLTQLGADPAKIHVMARGVDPERFAPGVQRDARRRLGLPLDRPVLLWVGRMVPVKALDVLIDACDRIRRRRDDVQLHLVGDGPLRRSLETDVAARGLDRHVVFDGIVLHDDLADWYRAADLTILPSHSEGSPNVLRESLACGTPFVASRVGGIPELASNGHGFLVPPGDPMALATAIESALASPTPISHSPSQHPREAVAPLNDILRRLVPDPDPRTVPETASGVSA